MAWLDLFVANGENGDDHHVEGIAKFPSLAPVGKGCQGNDAHEEGGTDQDLSADFAHGG